MKNETTVERFNRQFPPGSRVRWRAFPSNSSPYREYTVLYEAADHNGQAVAWFRERSGMVPVEPAFVDYENSES
jgi:hypothetical protein